MMLSLKPLIINVLLLGSLGVLSAPSDGFVDEPAMKRCKNCLARGSPKGHTRWSGHSKWIHNQKQNDENQRKNNHSQALKHTSDKQEKGKSSDDGVQFPQFSKGKLGLVWSMTQDHMSDYAQEGISWWYNWEAAPWSQHYPKDLTYCSMLWGEKRLDDYIEKVVKKPTEGPNVGKCTLGMNEVNLASQAKMSPQRACQLVRQYQLPLKKNYDYIIGSPSTANGPTGVQWMQDYKKTCPDVWEQTDFLTAHYYDTTLDGFKEWIKTLTKFDKPILITELAAYSFSGRAQFDRHGVSDFLQKAVSWAVEQDDIIGVGWSGFLTDQMPTNKFFTDSGKPNALFQQYQNIGLQALSSHSVKLPVDRHYGSDRQKEQEEDRSE
ncbi:unnamed protein product [Sympodiomycopsis kandeliae]